MNGQPTSNADADQPLIVTHEVTRTFMQGRLPVHALRGVTLQIRSGEFVGLVGPSGSGKTTLLNIIGALDHPTSGWVDVAGQRVTSMNKGTGADFRLDHVGFIFQAYNLVPVLTAYENAEFTLLLRGTPTHERRKIVLPLLDRVGLADEADRKPHELSGGQQQRVAIVRALATQPDIILADEPTANLDSQTSSDLLDLMCTLNTDLGLTFLFSSHDPIVIERVKRVVTLRDGQVAQDEVKT